MINAKGIFLRSAALNALKLQGKTTNVLEWVSNAETTQLWSKKWLEDHPPIRIMCCF